jgi:Flp pilus assembly protein TadG
MTNPAQENPRREEYLLPAGRRGGRLRRWTATFLADTTGHYSIMTAVSLMPILGSIAVGLDLSEMYRQREITLNALDAAALATARQVVTGATDAELKAYAKDFFEANLSHVDPGDTELFVDLPSNTPGDETLKLSASLSYSPYFFPAFKSLLTPGGDVENVDFGAASEVRLKNTLEVALVLDNSGSMAQLGSGSGQKRVDLLKAAAKQLVDTLAEQAAMIKQVEKPVQFALVPFAASVNVGPGKDSAPWMDTTGISPVHHENFDWSKLNAAVSPDKYAQQVGAAWYKRGEGWGASINQPLTRFSLYKDMTKVVSRERIPGTKHWVCYEHRSNGTCIRGDEVWDYDETPGPFASWQGCVEARPAPYNTNDALASSAEPATLFVPMFAPDEAGDVWKFNAGDEEERRKSFGAYNSWWNDGYDPSHEDYNSASASTRQKNVAKYFETRPYHAPTPGSGSGPNQSCTTKPITPLTDITTETGMAAVKGAIDAMEPIGGTNVPEGLAWGWRAVSGAVPFTEGRPDAERGNDKVVIVLTDGENTYYTPQSLNHSDPANNKSTYSSFGYPGVGYNGSATTRLFMGTSSPIGDYTNANYTNALNEQAATLCNNAKAANVLVMTVALDLSQANSAQAKQIEALKKCASDSRFRKDPLDPSKPAKLFWNTNGGELEKTFKDIADELSNLRIVS